MSPPCRDDNHTLVIVPCGRAKVWQRQPDAGPTPARQAYTGYPFRINVAYAERFGSCWLILSAKYGFIAPDFTIPGPYDVSFNRPTSGPISVDELREQVAMLRPGRWNVVIALGGRHYRETVSAAFGSSGPHVLAPFAGLPLGKMIRATRHALERDDPGVPL